MMPLSAADRVILGRMLPADLVAALDQPASAASALQEACFQLEHFLQMIMPFVPNPVLLTRLHQPQAQTFLSRYARSTLLMIDLANVSELAARYQARGRQGSDSLNVLLSRLTNIIYPEIRRRGGGVINMGSDTLIVVFDSALLGNQHASQACAAAVTIQQQVELLIQELSATQNLSSSLMPSRLRMGIHTGPLLLTEVGDEQQRTVMVTGHTAHRAALALEAASAGEVIVTTATHQDLPAVHADVLSKDLLILPINLPLVAPPALQQRRWQPGAPDWTTLRELMARIQVLAPYMPASLKNSNLFGAGSGEFRPVTVLVANFYGFSKLLEILEPLAILHNDTALVGKIFQTYYGHLQPVVAANGGVINAVSLTNLGDKFVMVFGSTPAPEDGALAAIQTGLDLPLALHNINRDVLALLRAWVEHHPEHRALLRIAHVTLRLRIGLSYGMAFMGIVGTADQHGEMVIGEPIQQATQLMMTARDGEVLLPAALRNVVRHQVETQPLPPTLLPGHLQPLVLYRAVQVHTATTVDSLPPSAPFIGRKVELGWLNPLSREALMPSANAGHVVAVIGNPGSGKSRLVAELLHTIRTTVPDAEIALDTCQSYEQTTPYACIARLLRHQLNLVLTGSLSDQAVALTEYLEDLVPEWSRFGPLLGPLVNVPLIETELTLALTPEQRRDRLHDLVAEIYLAIARRQPFVLVVDDLHWADASSQALVERLASSLHGIPLLLILPYRPTPPIPDPWRELAHTSVLNLEGLDQNDSATLLTALLQGELPAELHPLIERTQGTPFFLEEIVRYLLDTGLLSRTPSGDWAMVQPLDLDAIPGEVEDLIQARLDRLDSEARLLVQAASVIGRRFTADVVQEVVPPSLPLTRRLGELVNVSLIVPEAEAEAPTYLFKHALTRDVAYRSLQDQERQQLHAAVAAAIERLPVAQGEEYQAVLAQHYMLAGRAAQAFPYAMQAASQAKARYANAEAVTLYEQAIAIGPWHATDADDQALLLGATLHEDLGDVLTILGRFDVARSVFAEVEQLLPDLAQRDPERYAALQRRIATTYEKQRHYDQALTHLGRGEAVLTPADALARGLISADAGWIAFLRGSLNEAERLLRLALQAAHQAGDRSFQATVYRRLAGVYFRRSDLTGAQSILEQALQLSRELNDRMAIAGAISNLSLIAHEHAQWHTAINYAQEAYSFYYEVGDAGGQTRSLLNHALGNLMIGELSNAQADLESVFSVAERIRDYLHMGLANVSLGRVAFYQGQLGQARRYLLSAERLFRSTNSHWSERAYVSTFLARIAYARRKLLVAQRLGEKTLRLAVKGHNPPAQAQAYQVLALVFASQGNIAVGQQYLDKAIAAPICAQGMEKAHLLLAQALFASLSGDLSQAEEDQIAAHQLFTQLSIHPILRAFIVDDQQTRSDQ